MDVQYIRMNARSKRASEMVAVPGCCSQVDRDTFRVRSQTDPGRSYTVSKTKDGLVCECPDHRFRGADCKHIKVVLEKSRQNRLYRNDTLRIMERSGLRLCKFCDSGRIVKAGTNRGKQMFKCNDCTRRFTANFGFEGRRFGAGTITQAIQMYYQGMSVRDIANNLEMMGTDVSFKTVYNWVAGYSRMVSDYLDGIVPRTGDRAMVRADEVWIRVGGEQKYLFASMEDDTRYWLASDMAHTKFQHDADTLLELTRRQLGKSPAHFVTDGLQAYRKSSRQVFGRRTNHIRHIHLAGKRDRDNNNKMERFNGEVRDREKVLRGLKRFDTPLIDGMKAYYNYARKHIGLEGRTPAEEALIEVDGRNKWIALIQNASLHGRNSA